MGQTWTAATLVIYMSNTFSLEDREQSEDRAHRIGQENKVKYVDIACEGTVGVHVINAILLKRDFANYVKEMLKRDRSAVAKVA
jgi:SNF2 family DNA or RNA helicase